MKSAWSRWVSWCVRPVDARPAAATRILLALCVIFDLLRLAWVGLVDVVFRTWDAGGLSAFKGVDYLFAAWPDAGLVLYGTTLACMGLVAVGLFTRPAMLVGVLAYAQLGHLYPPGDRAIDRIIRTALLLLLMSGAHRRWSLDNLLRKRPPLSEIAAWPMQVLRWAVVLLYLGAGTAKVASAGWLSFSGHPVLYRIMTDPLAASLDHMTWVDLPWLFRAGAVATIVLELSAPLLLTRFAPWWCIGGIGLHLGIAATMELGMFSFGMLALYPVLMAPWFVRAVDGLRRRVLKPATTAA